MNTNGIPTIVLPGINPAEIADKFNRGEYVNMTLPKLDTQIVVPGSIGIRTNYSGNIHDPSFIVHGKSGIETIYHTTNSENYSKEHNLPNLEMCVGEKEKLCCIWCGYEVGNDYLQLPTFTEYTMSPNAEFILEVYGEGCYCGGRCCLADILEKGKGINKHDINYQNSEVVLRMIHFLKYPNEPTLEPAPPKHFLKKYNGALSREQFCSKIYTYTEVPNVHFLNSKCLIKQENYLNGVSFNGSILPKNKILNISRPNMSQPKAILPSIGYAPTPGAMPNPMSNPMSNSSIPVIPGLSMPPQSFPSSTNPPSVNPPSTIRNSNKGNRSILSFM